MDECAIAELIKDSTITRGTQVWRKGMDSWEVVERTDLKQYFSNCDSEERKNTDCETPPRIVKVQGGFAEGVPEKFRFFNNSIKTLVVMSLMCLGLSIAASVEAHHPSMFILIFLGLQFVCVLPLWFAGLLLRFMYIKILN